MNRSEDKTNQKMKEAVDFLYATPKFTTKNSLDHTRELMRLLGNPCLDRKIIHVAGSNGKGSVCSFLYSVLLKADHSVGLFTSPHLTDIRERFQVNGALVSKEDFLWAYDRVKNASAELVNQKKNHPTFFEFIFAMGMLLFEQAQVEYVILETGLGGRLDATNSFPCPVLSVITSISLEHTEILGDTIAQIAAEKAGIIKSGVPVVFDANNVEAEQVIRARAEEMGSFCVGISPEMYQICEIKKNFIDFCLSTAYDKKTKWKIPFSAAYQAENAAVAVTALRVLNKVQKNVLEEIPERALQEGIQSAVWPGRMQEVLPEVYFDGAHNVSGITVFVKTAAQLTGQDAYPPLLLFSMVKEKDYRTAIRLLSEAMTWGGIAVTKIPNERGIPAERMQDIFAEEAQLPVTVFEDHREALRMMRMQKKEGQKLFCTGSLYFIGTLMEDLESEGEIE